MKKIDIARVTELFANLGVIAGIVFLGFELRQNNELLQAQARRDQVDARTATALLELTNPRINQIRYKSEFGEPLTHEEQYQLFNYASFTFINWEWQYEEYRAGVFELRHLPTQNWIAVVNSNPQWQSVWQATKGPRSPEFIQFMEENVFD